MNEQFALILDQRVIKRLKRLPKKHLNQILGRIEQLKVTPRPQDSIKLKGGLSGYRITEGEYRSLYTIDYPSKKVSVYLVINRNEGYPTYLL